MPIPPTIATMPMTCAEPKRSPRSTTEQSVMTRIDASGAAWSMNLERSHAPSVFYLLFGASSFVGQTGRNGLAIYLAAFKKADALPTELTARRRQDGHFCRLADGPTTQPVLNLCS